MREVKLKFPDIATMAEFIITHKVSKVTTSNEEISLEGFVPDELVTAACQGYGAVSLPVNSTPRAKTHFSFN
ncbi:MAG TPA: hypothetical protein VGB56_12845 [Flavisolibacter sp.]|jgi:hypothetical protein